MSFSLDIKNEVTRLDSTKEELISELSAIVRNSATIDNDIVIYLENNSVARRIFKLFKNIYDVTPIITVRKKYFNNGFSYILTIKHKIEEILDDLSIVSDMGYMNIPLEYIVLETDCPYLTPEPYRGRKNEPANLKVILQKICDIKGIDYKTASEVTTENSFRLFDKQSKL